MERRNRFSLAPSLLGLGGLLCLVAPVHADSLTTPQSMPWELDYANTTEQLNFTPFNPALGVLKSVTISGDFSIAGTLGILDTSSSPVSFYGGYVQEPLTVSGPFAEMINQTAYVDDMAGTANPGRPNIHTGFNMYSASTGSIALQSLSLVSLSDILAFEESPTLVLSVGVGSVSQGATFTGSNKQSGQSTGSATVSGDLAVTYTYANWGAGGGGGDDPTDPPTVAPEPATTSVVIIGGVVGAAAMLHRRRRAKQF